MHTHAHAITQHTQHTHADGEDEEAKGATIAILEKAEADGRPQLVLFPTPNKDMPFSEAAKEAIIKAAEENNITALGPLCEKWAGNTEAIDGYVFNEAIEKSRSEKAVELLLQVSTCMHMRSHKQIRTLRN